MKTNEQIFSEINQNGFITYEQIKLLKNRSNKLGKDLINYDGDFEGFSVDKESGEKVLQWLKTLLNSKGEPRANVSLGYREIDIIQNATNEDFTFRGFYDNGNGYFTNLLPIYEVGGMEYVACGNHQKIYIIG